MCSLILIYILLLVPAFYACSKANKTDSSAACNYAENLFLYYFKHEKSIPWTEVNLKIKSYLIACYLNSGNYSKAFDSFAMFAPGNFHILPLSPLILESSIYIYIYIYIYPNRFTLRFHL